MTGVQTCALPIFFRFDIDIFSGSIDPVAPIIKLGDEQIEITGTALFNSDKMVGKIDISHSGLLLGLMNRHKLMTYFLEEKTDQLALEQKTIKGKHKGLAIEIRSTRRKVDIKFDKGIPVIDISLHYKTDIANNVSQYRMDDKKSQEELERELSESITRECMTLVKYMQEAGSDPIGLGEMIRSRYNSYWKSINWKDVYRDAKINVNVKVKVSTYGTVY